MPIGAPLVILNLAFSFVRSLSPTLFSETSSRQDVGQQADYEGGQSEEDLLLRILMSLQELTDVNSNPPPGCAIKLATEGDMNLWDVTMDGPEESVYKVSSALHYIL